MGKKGLVFSMILLAFLELNAQKEKEPLVSIRLIFDTLGYLDPLFIEIEINNSSEKTIQALSPWEGNVEFKFKHRDSSRWNTMKLSVFDLYPDDGPSSLTRFKPGAKVVRHHMLMPIENVPPQEIIDGGFIDHCLTHFCPGAYEMIGYYYPYKTKRKHDKADYALEFKLDFFVGGYQKAEDRLAYEWLSKQQDPAFLYTGGLSLMTREEYGTHVAQFLEIAPKSSFAPFAHYRYFSYLQSDRKPPALRDADYNLHYYQQIITHLEAAQSGTDNPWLLARVEPELQRHRQLLSSLRSRMEWEKKQQEKEKKDGNE
jgi:hypothetical protein